MFFLSMADKCYVHVDGTDWSFVCAPSSYASVDQLLDDTRRRYGARFPDAPALPGRLQALLGGVALANVRSIPSKADVMVCAAPEAPTSTPSDADALKRAGNTALVSGDLPAAVSHYTAALAATPAATPAAALLHCNRALAHLRLERWAEAEADAAQAVSGDAQNVKAHFRWAQALVAQGRHAEALPVLTSALDIACITNAQALEVGLMIAKCEEVVPSTSSAEDVSAAREARLPVAVYVRLKPFYEAAVESALAQRWAHAIGLYQKIIDINPADYTALLGLGTCLLRNKSHREADACTALATLCQHHGHDSFECWRLLGEAQCCAGRFDEALETLGKAANHLESGAADAEEVQLRTKEVKTWAARALSGQRKFDLALHFVSQVLSVDDTYVPALLAYGRLMIDYRAELDEALKVGLKCVTLAPKEREAKRLLCAVLGHPGMPERLLRALGPQLPASGYSYLGALAKEYSALPAAVMLFREALKREPSSASHALSLVHALEVHVDQEGALEALRAWLTSNREQLVRVPSTAASVSAAQLLEAWDDAAVPAIGWVESGHQLGKPVWATDADLDFLALAFALVKLLYLRGTLAPLPRLIGVVERVRCGWDFHLTTIRNEHAFYCCVAQCLASSFAPRAPDANADRLYVVGDSHCLPCAWQTLKARGDTTVVLEPRLVTGCKVRLSFFHPLCPCRLGFFLTSG